MFPTVAFLFTGALLAKPAVQEAQFSLTLLAFALGVACSVGLFVLGFFVVRALPVWGASVAAAGFAIFGLRAYFDQFCPLWVLTKGSANVRVTLEHGESQRKTTTRDYLSSEDFDADFAEFRVRRGRPGDKLTLTVSAGDSVGIERTYFLPKISERDSFGFVVVPDAPDGHVFLQVGAYSDAPGAGKVGLFPLESFEGVYVLPRKPDRVCQAIPSAISLLPGSGDEQVLTAVRLLTPLRHTGGGT